MSVFAFDPDGPRRLRSSRRWLWVAAAATAAVVGVAAVFVAQHPHKAVATSPHQSSSQAARTGSVSPGTASSSGAASAVDSLDFGSVSWQNLAGLNVPVSAQLGPTKTAGGLASGFAHSSAGAVVAGINIFYRSTFMVGSTVFTATIKNQVINAPGRDALQEAESDYQQYVPAGGVPGFKAGSRPVAYKVLSATSARVRFELVLVAGEADPAGGIRVGMSTFDVRWVAGDWRWYFPLAPVTLFASRSAVPAGLILFPGQQYPASW